MRGVKAIVLSAVLLASGCYQTNIRSFDAAVIPTDSRIDVGPDAPTFPCESDLTGNWQIVYGPECRQAPEVLETPFRIALPDCTLPGCDSTNCVGTRPQAPLCERVSRLQSPCAGTPRAMGIASRDRVVSPDLVEGSFEVWNDMEVITCSYTSRRVR